MSHDDVDAQPGIEYQLGIPAVVLVTISVSGCVGRRPVAATTVIFGELGLSGEVRSVTQTELRLGEAAKLGFRDAIVPARAVSGLSETAGITLHPVRQLADACDAALGS